MRSSDKNVTLHDVAAQSGVSYQTVSRVINNHPNVADSTRERVMKAIRQLGYRPNLAARSLVTNRSNTIAIMSFSPTFYGPSQMVSHITRQVKRNGYNVTLSTIEELGQAEIKRVLDDLHAQLIDGVIMIAPIKSAYLSGVKDLVEEIPLVRIDTGYEQDVAGVIIDHAHGSKLATEHLIELGHTKIAEISGPLDWYSAIMRHQSWVKTMQAKHLPHHMTVQGDWSSHSGYSALKHLLSAGADFSAVVVANDQMALGAIAALHEAGLRVPTDVSLVGFDDTPESAYFLPALTTIRQDFSALGEQSVDYLLSLIKNPDAPVHQRVLFPELVIRNSTASFR